MPATDERASGIILRTRPLTETSLIVHWLTVAQGRLATVAKGARRPKSALRGKLDLFFEADLSFRRSQRSDLHQLREVTLNRTGPSAAIRQDLDKLRQAAYAAALVEQLTETDTPIPEVHAFFHHYLGRLETESASAFLMIQFEMQLLALLGWAPDPEAGDTSLSPGARAIARQVLQGENHLLARLQVNPIQVKELKTHLRHFMGQHLGHIPKNRESGYLKEN